MSIRQNLSRSIVFWLLAILIPAVPAGGAAPLQKVVITFAGFNERSGILFVAHDMGFFQEQGLEPEIVQVRSGPIAISAMAAGDAQFYLASATGATLGAMAGGLDVVFIAGIVNKLDGDFVVAPKIKEPSDLKGKTLGVQSIGGGVWMFTRLALDYWGLVPERDKIQFRVVGDQSILGQAIMSGTIDGAYLGYTFSKPVMRQGYRNLADLATLAIHYQGIGVLTRRSLVDRSPELAEKTLKALVKTIRYIQNPANKESVMRILAKWLRLPTVQDAESGYDMIRVLYDPRIIPTKEGLANTQRILAAVDPKFARLKVDDMVDDRPIKKLEEEGFLK